MNYTITEIGDLVYCTLYNVSNAKTRHWSLQVSLFNASGERVQITGSEMAIDDSWYTEVTSEYGFLNMKTTRSAPTRITSGKNLNKSNATNVLTQAMSECTSKYNLKIRAGFSVSVANIVQEDKTDADKTIAVPFPMALAVYKNQKNKITYPVYVQPKLDGVRMLALLNSNGEVYLSSRRHKEIPGFANLKQELKKILKPGLILDGELYSHGMNLQDISGIVRSESNQENKTQLQFYVFDCFCAQETKGLAIKPDSTLEARITYLDRLVSSLRLETIVMTETQIAATEDQANEFYFKKIDEGYEGIVYKNTNRPYEFSFNREKRSLFNLKRKKAFDAEFKIVGYTQGKGKDLGCVIFICETSDGLQFNSVPNGDYAYRAMLYQDCVAQFDTKYKNKYCKVYYEDLSKTGVPLRSRIIQVIRDMSFD